MKWLWAALGIAIIGFCLLGFFVMRMSCGQRGYAIVGGMGGRDEWTLVNADGVPAGKYGDVLEGGNAIRLLTILFIAPGASPDTHSGSWDAGSRVAVFEVLMGYGEKRVEMGATWDKVDDVVTINGKNYDRRKGELFVVVNRLGGASAEVWQLAYTPNGLPQDTVVLKYLKAKLPKVEAVQAIELP